jgi:hypothetical protein
MVEGLSKMKKIISRAAFIVLVTAMSASFTNKPFDTSACLQQDIDNNPSQRSK